MGTRKFIFIAILIVLLTTLSVRAQVAASGTKHFEKNGLEFDYPAAWKIAEAGAEDSQSVELATENKTVQLLVQWQFGAILDCEFEGMRKRLTREMADRVAAQIHAVPTSATSLQKTKFGALDADQIQLHGQINNNAVTADVLSLVVKNYFLTLVYLRVANDESGNSAWDTIQKTLKMALPVPLEKGTPPTLRRPVLEKGTLPTGAEPVSLPRGTPSEGGVLNGRAIRLPRPAYPSVARARHAGGVVVVQVLIDELGNVIAACAVSGHPALTRVSEDAAREAKFTPTKLSGKSVKVIGLITYNFVPH